MTVYPYTGSYDTDQLTSEVVAAGLPPPAHINGSNYAGPGSPAGNIEIAYSAPLDTSQKTLLDQTVAAHVPAGPRKPRALYDIYTDIKGLTTAQKQSIWTDLGGGSPRKYLLDVGPNAAGIGALDWAVTDSGAAGASLQGAQMRIAAFYTQDNPNYLVHPPFDTSIDVPGDAPA
jgi:hypothetical protein